MQLVNNFISVLSVKGSFNTSLPFITRTSTTWKWRNSRTHLHFLTLLKQENKLVRQRTAELSIFDNGNVVVIVPLCNELKGTRSLAIRGAIRGWSFTDPLEWLYTPLLDLDLKLSFFFFRTVNITLTVTCCITCPPKLAGLQWFFFLNVGWRDKNWPLTPSCHVASHHECTVNERKQR